MTCATLLGLAIGDALGQPFEFVSTDMIIKSGWSGEFRADEIRKFHAGRWTDDTLCAKAIAESLIDKNGFDINHLAQKYIDWVKSGDLRGIGTRTAASIANLIAGISPYESGRKNKGTTRPSFKRISTEERPDTNPDLHGPGDFIGNGTVMRCAPIGVYFRNDLDKCIEVAKLDANITHDHKDARDASWFLSCLVGKISNGVDPIEAYNTLMNGDWESTHVKDMLIEAMEMANDKNTDFVSAIKLGVAGTAHETLASAVYCFYRYTNFKDTIMSAILMGGDADTRGAIAGALAGTYYGLEGIPEYYVKNVEASDMLIELDKLLYQKANPDKKD